MGAGHGRDERRQEITLAALRGANKTGLAAKKLDLAPLDLLPHRGGRAGAVVEEGVRWVG